jgi:hypothetical protein
VARFANSGPEADEARLASLLVHIVSRELQ